MGSIGFVSVDGGGGTVLDAVVSLLAADPARCDRDELTSLARRSLRVRSWLDALDAAIASQVARLAGAGVSADAAAVLGGGGRRGRRDAEAAAARGMVCDEMRCSVRRWPMVRSPPGTSMRSPRLPAPSTTTAKPGSPGTPTYS
jgi:hypothetical protein